MNKKVYEYISGKSWEEIIEWRVCKWTWEDFPIFKKELEILEQIAPIFDWVKYSFPLPEISPRARAIKRMLWRNERWLYKRKCDLTGGNVLSVYSNDYEWKVYNVSDYNSDKWDRVKYELEFNENENIKDTIGKFFNNVPKKATNLDSEIWMENCDYCNFWMNSKNCYMCQSPLMAENCYYSYTPLESKNVVDWYLMTYSENCYESIWSPKCYKLFYSQALQESSDCYFSYYLKNCKYCIWCVDLDWKEYHIFNEKVSKEEYEEKLKEIFSSYKNVEKFKKEFEKFKTKFPLKATFSILSENCFWSWFQHSRNLIECYDCIDLENSLYCSLAWNWTSNIVDTYAVWLNSTHVYDSIWISWSHKSAFWFFSSVKDSYYFSDSRYVNNSLFISWLRNKEYCIFNKQYTKKEYNKLVPEIIKKMEEEWFWGAFFPTEFSPFPYNDTIANYYYPIEKVVYLDENKNVLKQEINDENWEGIVYVLESDKFISEAILDFGWEEKIKIKWRTKENEINIPEWIEILKSENLPEIFEVEDSILNKVIICEQSKRPFRLIKQELEFYKKYNIPLPRLHPDVRFKNRLAKRAKFDLFLRDCSVCGKEVLSAWNKESIICEECYDKENY